MGLGLKGLGSRDEGVVVLGLCGIWFPTKRSIKAPLRRL